MKSCQVELRCRLMPPQLWSYDCSSGTWSHLFVWPGTESIHSQKAAQSSQPSGTIWQTSILYTIIKNPMSSQKQGARGQKTMLQTRTECQWGPCYKPPPKMEVYGSSCGDSKQSHTATFQSNLMSCQCKGKRSQRRKILTSTWRCRSQTEAAPVHRFNSVTNLND